MGKLYLIPILSLCIFVGQAQSELRMSLNKEGKLIAVPTFKPKEMNIPAYSFHFAFSETDRPDLEMRFQEFIPHDKWQIEERPMDIQVLSSAYAPFFDIYAPMKRKMYPMAFDFSETTVTPLNENVAVRIHGQKVTWPSLGGMTTINPMLVWNSNNWTISGGVFGGHFYSPMQLSPNTLVGANARVSFQATDWLKVNAWGQYTDMGESQQQNPFVTNIPLYNHTNIGGSMEFKLNDQLGVGLGVQQEFNVMKRKWETYPIFYPIFYGK